MRHLVRPSAIAAAAIACTALPLLFAPVAAQAATLTLAGTISGIAGDDNDEVDRWRTTSVLKSLDLDGDNIYGTAGYVMFAVDDAGNSTVGNAAGNINPFTYSSLTRRTLSSIPSYLSFTTITPGSTGVASSYGYRLMDDPTATPGPTVANVESGAALRNSPKGTEASIFDITIGANFPEGGLRLGMFFANTDAYNGYFRLEQTVGGSTSLTVNQTAALPLQMAFFDITDAAPGDTFRVYGFKNDPPGGNANDNFLLGGFTFDAVPEPASTASLLAGLATLLAHTRRRRRA